MFNLAIDSKLRGCDLVSLIGPENLRHPLSASGKSCLVLPPDRQPPSGTAATGHTKIESTVRYLGIEVDDALAIAEQVDV